MVISRLVILVALICRTAFAGPVVLYNNFGPGDTYDVQPGITFGCGAFCWQNPGLTLAFAFTPSSTAAFTELEMVAGFGMHPANILASIRSDSGGLPGAVLESFSTPLTWPPTRLQFNSILQPTLAAGMQYWVVAAVPDPVNDMGSWSINSIGANGPQAGKIGDGPWTGSRTNIDAVFRVTGDDSSVPEPSALALLVLGLAGILGLRRAA